MVDDVGDVALPLYEGRMIGQFDFSEKGWVSGKGRSAEWRAIDFPDKSVEPQYLMGKGTYHASDAFKGDKVGFLAIGSATNSRTMFAAAVSGVPCGNSVAVLRPSFGVCGTLALVWVLNTYCFDFMLRLRLGGLNLNYFVVADTAPLSPTTLMRHPGALYQAARLAWPHRRFAGNWLRLKESIPSALPVTGPRPATDPQNRKQIRAWLEARAAVLWGLDVADISHLLGCDLSAGETAARHAALDPKGFWREERDLPPQQRLATYTLAELQKLSEEIFDAHPAEMGDYEQHAEWNWPSLERHAQAVMELTGQSQRPKRGRSEASKTSALPFGKE